MFKALWYVHQVSFCCISTIRLLPYIREYQKKYSDQALSTFDSVDAELRELADKTTKALAEDAGQFSPGPRYAVILNELKEEVLRQVRDNQVSEAPSRWKMSDWLDLDSAACALFPFFEASDLPLDFVEFDNFIHATGNDNTGH